MEALTLEASKREVGKKAAHELRRQGNVPCVLYGHNIKSIAFQVPEISLHQFVYTMEMHLVRIVLDGKSWDCVMKHVDFHPVTDSILHADFQAIKKGEKLKVAVPVKFIGTPIGQREGGTTRHILHDLVIRCLPKDLPTCIEINVEDLHIGDAIHINDLKSEKFRFEGAPTDTVVSVVQTRVTLTEAEQAMEEEEEEETSEAVEEETPAS